jgi:hypothetical protein
MVLKVSSPYQIGPYSFKSINLLSNWSFKFQRVILVLDVSLTYHFCRSTFYNAKKMNVYIDVHTMTSYNL